MLSHDEQKKRNRASLIYGVRDELCKIEHYSKLLKEVLNNDYDQDLNYLLLGLFEEKLDQHLKMASLHLEHLMKKQ